MAQTEQASSGVIDAEATADETGRALAGELAERVGGFGIEVAGVAGNIEDVAQLVHQQADQFHGMRGDVQKIIDANQQIDGAAQNALETARESAKTMSQSRETVENAIETIRELVSAVTEISSQLENLSTSLNQVAKVSGVIDDIASQTNLLALNATIEAARAGDAGRGFAVVASEVKNLAGQTANATTEISSTVGDLNTRVDALQQTMEAASKNTEAASTGTNAIGDIIAEVSARLQQTEEQIGTIASASDANQNSCAAVNHELTAMGDSVDHTADNLRHADDAVQGLLNMNEDLMEVIAQSGCQTVDTPFVQAVTEFAAQISDIFEQAVREGEISADDLFDRNYEDIPATDPAQVMGKFTAFTDRVLPAIQEPALELDERVVFCAAVDTLGYLPTHNSKFSRPQGNDPVWNAANCRNRRMFVDRTGLAAAQNTKPFLLQTYRRDMGGGEFAIMKDVSAPIVVNGRHWGGLRLAYRA